MVNYFRRFAWQFAATVAIACAASTAFASTTTGPIGINGFGDPAGFTLNANNDTTPGAPSATAHGVPAISGGILHLTTAQGVSAPDTFYGSERASAFCKIPQNITSFTASFTYTNNGPNPNPASFGPGDTFIFVLQNDPRGSAALGNDGAGYGGGGDDSTTITPSEGIAWNLFTGFGDNRGPALVANGNNDFVSHANCSPVDIVSGHPIAITIYYNGTVLSENMVDTVTHDTFSTSYPVNLVAALGGSTAYVGFTGGTGAAVEEQYISNFIFTNNSQTAVNLGPKLTVTAKAVSVGNGQIQINVTTTNTGGTYADFLQITNVTLNGSTTTSTLPTTPDLLSPPLSQTNGFLFTPPSGTSNGTLHVSGQYINPLTNGTATFSATIRIALPT